MGKSIKIPGRLESAETGNIVAGANAIKDDTRGKTQAVVNNEVEAAILNLAQNKQNVLTFDQTPTEDSTNPVTSGGVYAADKLLSDAIEAILLLIPSAASSLNKLVDLATMNSSIATATASFKGTYNLVSDLHLSVDATHAQIAAALDALSLDADNNDYAFVQVPNTDTAPTEIKKTERYKFNGTNWAYEYDLNNSGFTSAQWNAINSGITALLVSKLSALPTNDALVAALAAKQDNLTFDNLPTSGSNNPVTSGGVYTRNAEIVAMITALDTAKQDVLAFDNTPTEGSSNPVKSGGVYLAISALQGSIVALDAAKQDKLTFDSTPTLGSTNPVTSSGIKTELNRIDGNITTLDNLYRALTQSALVVVQPTDTWPVANPDTTTIYRVVDRTNTPPQNYSDYMWNGSAMVLMATYDNAIDDVPTVGSNNLVKSGGVFNMINNVIGGNHVSKGGSGTAYYLNDYTELDSTFDFDATYTLNAINNLDVQRNVTLAFSYDRNQTSATQIASISFVLYTTKEVKFIPSDLELSEAAIENNWTIEDTKFLRFTVERTNQAISIDYYISKCNSDIVKLQNDVANKLDKDPLYKVRDTTVEFYYEPIIKNIRVDSVDLTLHLAGGVTLGWLNTITGESFDIRYQNGSTFVDLTVGNGNCLVLEKTGSYYFAKLVNYDNEFYVNSSKYVLVLHAWNRQYYGIIGPVVERFRIRQSGNIEENYYNDYLNDKVKSFTKNYLEGNTINDSFVFLTDSHVTTNYGQSGKIVKSLFEKSFIYKCIFGGDVCSVQDTQSTADEVALFNKFMEGPIKSNGKLYNVKGNHDFYNRMDSLPVSAPYNQYMNDGADIVKNESSENGCYYYFDNKIAKIRYIVYDSHEGVTGYQNVSNAQIKWLVEEAFMTTPNGYNVILIGHVPFTPLLDVSNENTEGTQAHKLDALITLCNAAKNHLDNITLAGETYDFTDFNGELIMCLSGHSHMDIQTYINGLLFVTTANDSKYDDQRLSPFYSGTELKEESTINEQLLDVVTIKGNMKILFQRIGVGYDRAFNLNPITISVGGTYQLSASLVAVSWVSNDCEKNVNNGYDDTNNIWKYLSNICSVSSSGLVTGLASGEAFVFAEDANHNKEFFYIRVE